MPPQPNESLTPVQTPAKSCPWYQPLCKVTPVSKYLAMTLFIAMPFIGAYIGYKLATERAVEAPVSSVAPDAMKTNPSEVSGKQSSKLSFDELKQLPVGSNVDGMTIKGVEKNNLGTDIVVLDGTIEVEGYITANAMDKYFFVSRVGEDQKPLFEMDAGFAQEYVPLLVNGLDVLPEYKAINFDDGSRSATTTILVSGLRIYDHKVANSYYETKFVSLKSTTKDTANLQIVSCVQGTEDIPGLPLSAIETALQNYSPDKSDFINEDLHNSNVESGSKDKVGFHCTLNDGSTILTIFGSALGDLSVARISKNVMTSSVAIPVDEMGSSPEIVPKNSTTTVSFTGHIIDPCYDLAQNFIFNLTDFSLKLISKTGGDIPNCKANI